MRTGGYSQRAWLRIVKRNVLICVCMALFFAASLIPELSVNAEGFDYNAWLAVEQAKYPAGKYWNHVGMSTDNSEGYTGSPCALHGVSGVDHVYGTNGCTCNHFADPKADSVKATYPAVWHYSASQCMGFANKLGYDMFGSTMWSRITSASDSNYKANIKVGDIIRISGHSSFVVSKTADNKVNVAECNYTSNANGCVIAWGRTIDLNSISGFEYYERAQNYDLIIAGTITPTQQTGEQGITEEGAGTEAVDSSFTGWKTAADGTHYQYYKAGKLLKSQWITVSKKKYYLDAKGYRVTGLSTIKKKLYYFNDNGVLQTKQWLTLNGKTYYIGASGYALKSQWLYKGNLLVYVKSDCTVAKSELVKIGSSTYYFNSKSKRSKGFKKVKGKYYYCNANGIIYKKRWIKKSGKKYYVQKSGVRVDNKLVKIGKYKYYFNSKGVLQKNTEIEYNNKIYKADANGRCKFVEYADNDDTTDTSKDSTEVSASAAADTGK